MFFRQRPLLRCIHIGDELAVKVLPQQDSAEGDVVARFRREAPAAATLLRSRLLNWAAMSFGNNRRGRMKSQRDLMVTTEKRFTIQSSTRWAWLFPVTYLLHLAEEYWGGEGFPGWISRVAGANFTEQDFLTLNALALGLMTVGALLIRKNSWPWLLLALGGVVFLNGVLHGVFSVLTWSYSPGLISGLLCWMPLGAIIWYVGWQQATRRSLVIGASLALGLQALVSLLAWLG